MISVTVVHFNYWLLFAVIVKKYNPIPYYKLFKNINLITRNGKKEKAPA
jgi:hypothetical protein